MTRQPANALIAAINDRAKPAIRITTGLRAASQSIAWIGAATGTFAKHALDVAFPRLEVGGPASVAGLLRGDWDVVQTGTVPVPEAVLNSGDAVILLCNTVPHDDIAIVTRREIANFGQLAGRTVGVLTDTHSGQGGVMVRLAAERAGAVATYVGLGTYRNIFAALVSGEIAAGALPIDVRFLDPGRHRWNWLATRSLGVPSVVATTRRTIRTDRGRILRLLRGFVETVHLFKTRPEVVVPLLQDFLGSDDRRAVGRLREHYASLIPDIPRPALSEGTQGLRDLFCDRYPAARNLQESDIADPSLIEKLEHGGFIRELRPAGARFPAPPSHT